MKNTHYDKAKFYQIFTSVGQNSISNIYTIKATIFTYNHNTKNAERVFLSAPVSPTRCLTTRILTQYKPTAGGVGQMMGKIQFFHHVLLMYPNAIKLFPL